MPTWAVSEPVWIAMRSEEGFGAAPPRTRESCYSGTWDTRYRESDMDDPDETREARRRRLPPRRSTWYPSWQERWP